MNYKLLYPLKYRFDKLLRPDVAWQNQSRLLGTAAAREIPNMPIRTRKRVSANERRAIVEEYINKYRMMNAGKFPTVSNIQGQVGGCYYKTKAILQELEYNTSKLPTVATAANISTIQQTAQINCTSDAGVSPDCQVSGKENRSAVVDEYGTSAECYSSYEVDTKSDQKMVDMSSLNKNHEIAAENISVSERKVDLKLGGEHDVASADMDMSDNSRILESSIVPSISNVVENTLDNETLMAMTMGDPGSPAKPSHPSEVTGISGNPKAEEIGEASGQDFKPDELTRVTQVGKFSARIDSKKQVSDPESATIEGLGTSMVGGEVNKTFEVEKILDCEVRVGRTVTVNDYQVSAENDSSSQMEVDDDSCQKMIDTSILIKSNEVTTADVCRSEKLATMSVKTKTTEDCEIFAKPSHTSEVPKTSQNTEIGELDDASGHASKCDRISRVTTARMADKVKESPQSSLWGSLKFFASNVISRWRKHMNYLVDRE